MDQNSNTNKPMPPTDLKLNVSTMTGNQSQQWAAARGKFVPTPAPSDSLQRKGSMNSSRIFGAKGPTTDWGSIHDMPSSISEYAIDPAVWNDPKSTDIKRHDMDDKLDDFNRALICLGGDLSQKIYAAHSLANLAMINSERTFLEIFPVIENELKKNPVLSLHSEVAASVVPLFKQVLRSRNPKWIKQIISLISLSMNYTDPEIVSVWIQAMEKVIDQMSPKDAVAQILPIALEKSQTSAVIAKNSAMALMRKLLAYTNNSNDAATKSKVFQTALTTMEKYLKDQIPSVRAAAVMLMSELIKSATPEKSAALTQTVMQSAGDPDPVVKTSLVDVIAELLIAGKGEPATQRVFLDTMKKMVREAYVHKPPTSELLVNFSKSMGPMTKSQAISKLFTNEDKYWFLDAYFCLSTFGIPGVSKELPPGFSSYKKSSGVKTNTLLSTGDTEKPSRKGGSQDENDPAAMVRANCAEIFLDMMKFARPSIGFRDGFQKIFHNFFNDPSPDVRKNIAGLLHKVMEDVGKDIILCKNEMIRAFSDDNIDVIEALVPNLSQMLRLFVKFDILSPEKVTPEAAEIGGAILFCEERLSQTRDWRIHSSLLLQLVVLPFCMPSDILFQNFVPIILHRLLHLKQLPSRLGAGEALISLLRHCRRSGQRDEIRRKIKGFAQSRNAQDRMIYLYMNDIIMNRFSRKYYRQHFIQPTLGLAEDKIPNVRTKAYRSLPKVREKIGDNDSELLKKLEELVDRIQKSEKDRDALEAITAAIEQMAKSGVIPEVRQRRLKEEKDDKKKETEENYIASLEEKMPKGNPVKKFSVLEKGTNKLPEEKPKPTIYLKTSLDKPNNVPKLSIAGANAMLAEPSNANLTPYKYKTSFSRTSKNIVPLAKKQDVQAVPKNDAGSSQTSAPVVKRTGK